MMKELFEKERVWFREERRRRLDPAQPVTESNVDRLEEVLIETEVIAARRALIQAGTPAWRGEGLAFAQQWGTTCMSTSLGNALISMGEAVLVADIDRVGVIANDIVANTSAFGKPGEYRSVDDLFKYLETGRLKDIDLDAGVKLAHDYRVRLTNSLVDVCEALWTGKGRLVVQRSAHARLIFALEDDTEHARLRDPLNSPGKGYDLVSLVKLRRDFLWSPLKKIPRLMGAHGFASLSAAELLEHLDRYDAMNNLGVDCTSALVFRADEAPPRAPDPPPDEQTPAPTVPRRKITLGG